MDKLKAKIGTEFSKIINAQNEKIAAQEEKLNEQKK